MESENTFSLVKELEKINSMKSKNSFSGAIITLIVSIILLSALLYKILSFQSFIIINHQTNKKISIIIQTVLELSKSK